jgi:putative chitobiose transport system permease protein
MNNPRKVLGNVLTYALLAVIALFALFPFLWTLAIAITDKTVTSGVSIYDFPRSLFPTRITLGNFAEVFETFGLAKYLLNSLIITAATVVGTLLISVLAAYPLAKLRFPGKTILFTLILATLVLPSETNFIVNILTLQKLKLLNTYWGVVIPTIATAFGIFIVRQAYLMIPDSLSESARIDGASDMQILWRVLVPLSVPSLTALGIFTLVNTWNSYFWPSVALIFAPEKVPLSVAVLRLKGDFNYDPFNVAAGSMIMMIPVLIIFIAAQRFFMRGLEGAVKG